MPSRPVKRSKSLDLNRIVEDLKKERGRLDRAIAALEESTSRRIVVKNTSVAAQQRATAKGNKLGGITPEGRKRLSLAMKKRWAERKKKSS